MGSALLVWERLAGREPEVPPGGTPAATNRRFKGSPQSQNELHTTLEPRPSAEWQPAANGPTGVAQVANLPYRRLPACEGDLRFLGRGYGVLSGLRRGSVALMVTLVLLVSAGSTARAEGIIGTNSTTAILQALLGGGEVRVTTGEILTPEIPLIIAADTVLLGQVTGGRLATFSGGGVRRLFHVLPGVRFEMRDCIVREGTSTNGGGVYNQGSLVLSNVVFAGCKAVGGDGAAGRAGEDRFGVGGDGSDGEFGRPAYGGAIYNAGEVSILDSIFSGNVAQGGKGGDGGAGGTGTWANGIGGDGGAGAEAHGGAIFGVPGSRLAVTNTFFSGNTATAGGGGSGGADSAVLGSGHGGRGALASGGAIHSAGGLWVVRSAFATNGVTGGAAASAGSPEVNLGRDGPRGGHAWGGAIASWSTGTVINSTFFTNSATGGAGGNGAAGVFVSGKGGEGGHGLGGAIHARGILGLTNVTLVANGVTGGAGGTGGSGGFPGSNGAAGRAAGSGIASDGATADVVNSIITAPAERSTLDGGVRDRGHNLFSDRGTGSTVAGSVYSAEPGLSEFKVWLEFTTPAMVPLVGSLAVDAADPVSAPAVDQRGLTRPAGRGPDIGSVESAASLFLLGGAVYIGTEKVGLPGVVVEVGALSATTDAAGRFMFGPMPTGFYTVAIAGGGVGFTPRVVQVPLLADATNVVFRVADLVVRYQRVGGGGNAGVLTALGLPSRTYRLEGSRDFEGWAVLGRMISDAEGRIEFRHDPGNPPTWYYRMGLE